MKSSRQRFFLAGCALLLAGAAAGEPLNYDYVYFSHQQVDQDNNQETENDAYGGYWEFTQRLHMLASYGDGGFYAAAGGGNVDSRALRLGLGAHWLLGEDTMIAPELAVIRAEYDVPGSWMTPDAGYSYSDTGYGAIVDLRHRLAPRLELLGSARYTRVFDGSQTQFVAGPIFHLNEHIALGALYQSQEGDTGWELTIRWYY